MERRRLFPLLRETAPIVDTVRAIFVPQTVTLGEDRVIVPIYVKLQVAEQRRNEVPNSDLVQSVARGEWAQSLARAFCLPEERFNSTQISASEQSCIENMSVTVAKELVG